MESIEPPSWGPPVAYLYTLKLDACSLAWEYLRRNPSYRSDFSCAMRHPKRDLLPKAWGLARWEDPREDARFLEPAWLGLPHSAITLVPSDPRHTDRLFDFWSIPGRKSLRQDGAYLTLTTRRGSEVLHRVRWPEDLSQGHPLGVSMSAGRGLTVRNRTARDFLRSLDRDPRAGCPERPSSHALTHMQILHALDGEATGASQRDIARRLFGSSAISGWDADSRWRARVRYLLRCGRVRCAHGYRQMAGLGHDEPPSAPLPTASPPPRRSIASTQLGTLVDHASTAGALA